MLSYTIIYKVQNLFKIGRYAGDPPPPPHVLCAKEPIHELCRKNGKKYLQ
jgi:hypothetical protein